MVKKNAVKLFTRFAGAEARFFCTSSSRGECFQVVIQPSEENKIKVDAWSIETIGDEEFHAEWTTSVFDLTIVLNSAMKMVKQWMNRS